MRIKHYIKNFLVVAPLFFSMNFTDLDLITRVLFGFISFSLITSVVYILNDINDIEKDRAHPIKKNRPLANGQISTKTATYLAIGLFSISVLIEYLFHHTWLSLSLLLGYLIINIAYSKGLKKIPIVDVSVIVSGFLLRIFYGGSILNIPISNWLVLTILAISYYLAFGKRRNELKKNGDVSRDVLKHYNAEFLDKMMYVMLGLFIVFYSMWSVSSQEMSTILIWSVPIVILIVLKYSLIIENDSFGDPADVVFSDKILIGLILLYGIFMVLALYLFV